MPKNSKITIPSTAKFAGDSKCPCGFTASVLTSQERFETSQYDSIRMRLHCRICPEAPRPGDRTYAGTIVTIARLN